MKLIPSLFAGPKPPLRPTSPAPFAQPDEPDRQALFWWLKRNTSYTAIENNAKLWSKFAAEWETWLRSQDDPYEGDITTFKYILDDQINYEEGLKRLRRGDRSVWTSRASYGYLDKLNTGLVFRREEWDGPPEFYAQFGTPVSMIYAYFKAHNAAMACGRTTSYRGMGFPRNSARSLLAELLLDTALPEPCWDVSFAPGKRAPKDGIYEMVNLDGHIVGSLQHFIKSETANPEDFVEFGTEAGNEHATNFLWRLLWEDTRYKDGSIPEEEKHYPTPEQSLALVVPTTPEVLHLRCPAGQPCPKAGYWLTPAKLSSRRLFKQGEVMPDFDSNYGATIWQWDEQQ